MKGNYREIDELKKGMRYIRWAFPYLLSHHPHCRWYEKDVLHLGKVRLCWGCIVTYPVAIITLVMVLSLGLHHRYPWYVFILLGFAFGSFEFISLWRKGTGLRHRIIKFFLGIGISLATVGVFMIPIHILFRMYIFFTLFTAAGMLMSFRIIAMENKCKRCAWKGNWYQCPGFEELNSNLEKEGLLKRESLDKWKDLRRKGRMN
ncbi:MAG: hypothetical protein R6V01_09860 [Thermoplasmatota archaeon]